MNNQTPTPPATIGRTIWQGYDAAGHSLGRSRTCGVFETAMALLGQPDSIESRMADSDIKPLLDEAKEWIHIVHTREMEEHYRDLDEGSSSTSEKIAKEIESGLESRMR